jgi:hypothetical protein
MKPFRVAVWPCALVLLAAGASPTQAAWCNVFQVCCNTCGGHTPVVSGYAPQACCPQPTCVTQYRARCYYEPVTCYQTKTYYEPVTTYRTSYYYEPVTTYRTSCYYDPCTCSYQQVCTPCTSYQVRSQCCPVQSWVQRCCNVPVTTYRQSFYWEPVTTCCAPPPQPCCPPAAPAAAPCATEGAPPAVGERRGTPAPPGVNEYPGSIPAPLPDGRSGSNYRQIQPQTGNPDKTSAPVVPSVKLDRVAALPRETSVEGQVVRADNQPRAGVEVLFINADRKGGQQQVASDGSGRFRASLSFGSWWVYVHDQDGKPVFQTKLEVGDRTETFTLVSK